MAFCHCHIKINITIQWYCYSTHYERNAKNAFGVIHVGKSCKDSKRVGHWMGSLSGGLCVYITERTHTHTHSLHNGSEVTQVKFILTTAVVGAFCSNLVVVVCWILNGSFWPTLSLPDWRFLFFHVLLLSLDWTGSLQSRMWVVLVSSSSHHPWVLPSTLDADSESRTGFAGDALLLRPFAPLATWNKCKCIFTFY